MDFGSSIAGFAMGSKQNFVQYTSLGYVKKENNRDAGVIRARLGRFARPLLTGIQAFYQLEERKGMSGE